MKADTVKQLGRFVKRTIVSNSAIYEYQSYYWCVMGKTAYAWGSTFYYTDATI